MRAMIWHFAPADRSQQLWTLRESQHLTQFYVVLQRLGVRSLQLTLHGLRGGDATEHWLSQRDIPGPRRRGRWTSERTLERYVQEGAFCLHTLSLDNDSAGKIRELATLAPSFFAGVLPDPPPSPATTEKTERGGEVESPRGVPQLSRTEVRRVAPFLINPLHWEKWPKNPSFERKADNTLSDVW